MQALLIPLLTDEDKISKPSDEIGIKVNVAVYKELFLEHPHSVP